MPTAPLAQANYTHYSNFCQSFYADFFQPHSTKRILPGAGELTEAPLTLGLDAVECILTLSADAAPRARGVEFELLIGQRAATVLTGLHFTR